jgi:hypothetical protein
MDKIFFVTWTPGGTGSRNDGGDDGDVIGDGRRCVDADADVVSTTAVDVRKPFTLVTDGLSK